MTQALPTAPEKKPTKTAFVLSMPADLPAAEVIKRAAVAGLELSVKGVYNIRSEAKHPKKTAKPTKAIAPAATKATKKTTSPSKAAKPAAKKSTTKTSAAPKKTPPKAKQVTRGAKAPIARSVPRELPAHKAVAAATKPKPPVTSQKKAPETKNRSTPVMAPEMVFVRLALNLGLDRAKDLLAAVDAKLAGLIASI